jgi:hypothetical protein
MQTHIRIDYVFTAVANVLVHGSSYSDLRYNT